MIKLSFVIGSGLRKVVIDDRKVIMITQETGFTPLEIDLDKINDSVFARKMSEEQLELMKVVSLLETEVEISEDIIKDFQLVGWRLIKRE